MTEVVRSSEESQAFSARIGGGVNRILNAPVLESSVIKFSGKGNVLVCTEPGIVLRKSKITFSGDNGLVYLGATRHGHSANISLWHDSVVHIGRNGKALWTMTIVASEQKHVFIGDDCLFARNIFFRTADSHLIYDIDSSMRISTPRSVFVGDHVWIGQNALLLKGTQLGSGSIIGAASVVAGKRLSSNCAYAGNPVHKVREGVWFSSASTHAYTEQDARKAERNGSAKWVYKFSQAEAWPFEALEAAFAATYSVDEKIAYLNGINSAVSHNRFVIP